MVLVTADLAAWLTAVWDEEERLAKAASGAVEWACLTIPRFSEGGAGEVDMGDSIVVVPTPMVAAHIAYHDPASVLARIAADRKILAEHAPSDGNCRTCCGESYREVYWDGEEETVEWERAALAWPCPTIRLKAEQYAARPDFPEWLVERQGVEG